MRRKKGALLMLEQQILDAIADRELHGFAVAAEVQRLTGQRIKTGHGTLYRALGRLEDMGYLTSRWEDPAIAAQENRPRRRYYRRTPARGASSQEGE